MIGSAQPVLEISELRKSYGGRTALQGVSFSLAPSERLAFLGPNGAGKTTLIRCLSGRARPDRGQIRLFDQPIEGAGIRHGLGIVPQEIAVYPDLTTRENLTAFGRFHGLRGRGLRERVRWALAWTGLESRAEDLVGTFSGGMKRRVNLACGVLHSPKVLLLDEPTVGVDPQSREKIFAMLADLNAAGTAILLTTHHLDEAQTQSDRIVIIDQGRVVADGTFEQLLDETVGRHHLVKLRVDRPLDGSSQWLRESAVGSGKHRLEPTGPRMLTTRIDDVAVDLPEVIGALREQGFAVSDVDVQAPSLHHVFLHLTGRGLRD